MPGSDRLVPVGAAWTEEWEAAFRLLFAHCPPEELPARVGRAVALIEKGELDAGGLFVVRDGDRVAGAVVCTVAPGGSGLVWPPRAAGPDRTAHEDRLARHAVAWLRQRGARLGQCLLHPDEAFLAAPLLRNGFDHVTALWYLRHDRAPAVPHLGARPRLTFEPYDRADCGLFHATLLRTYEGTLDCPEVVGLRTLDEVLTGHQAQGRFDPALWWLGLDEGRPVGVLLTADLPDLPGWEVAYVGVVPEARRRGFGRGLMGKVLREARAAAVPALMLTVDARNAPAWELYRSLGFEPFDRREVFLSLWE